MSTLQLKNKSISAEPRLVTDRTSSRPGTVLTISSIGRVIATSICSIGITPLSMPMMMRGKLVVGNTATGRVTAATIPIAASVEIRKMIDVEWRANQ